MKSILLTASFLLLLAGCSASIQTATQYYQFEQPIGASSRNVVATDAQLRVQTVVLRGALNNLGIAIVPTSLQHGFQMDVKFIELKKISQKATLSVIWKPDNRNPALQHCMDLLLD